MLVHAFLIKYAEIALKGKNRYRFEDALVHQMEIALSKIEGDFEVKKEQGRVYVFCPENYDYDEAVDALQHVFGIVGICPVMIYEEQGFEKLAEDVVGYMKQWHPDFNGSFKVWTRRAKKSYPISSMEVSAELGGRILDAFPEASVDVHHPELDLSVEIRDKIYVYSQTIPGAGGMPIGTNGKAMLLLSEEESIRIYGKRWQIEVFFKNCKSMLNLIGECPSLSYDALTAHVAIVCG